MERRKKLWIFISELCSAFLKLPSALCASCFSNFCSLNCWGCSFFVPLTFSFLICKKKKKKNWKKSKLKKKKITKVAKNSVFAPFFPFFFFFFFCFFFSLYSFPSNILVYYIFCTTSTTFSIKKILFLPEKSENFKRSKNCNFWYAALKKYRTIKTFFFIQKTINDTLKKMKVLEITFVQFLGISQI